MRKSLIIWVLCITVFAAAEVFPADDIQDVRSMVYAWSTAWQNKDIDGYISFYSPVFRSNGTGLQGLRKKKTRLFQAPGAVSVKIADLWVFVEGDRAVASFIQQYEGPFQSSTGEKKLTLAKSGGAWKIVAEEWKLSTESLYTPGVPKAAAGPEESNKAIPAPENPQPVLEKKDSSADALVVKRITFERGEKGEKVFVELTRFLIPRVQDVDGDHPRIVIDIPEVSFWKGPFTVPVNGRLIRQIRAYLHQDIETLRIVLDLNPAKNYTIAQTYDTAKNLYSLEVQ